MNGFWVFAISVCMIWLQFGLPVRSVLLKQGEIQRRPPYISKDNAYDMGLSCFLVSVPEDPPFVEVIPGRCSGFYCRSALSFFAFLATHSLWFFSLLSHQFTAELFITKSCPLKNSKSFILHETRGSLVGFTVSTSSYLKTIACLKGYSNPWIKSTKITKLVVWKKIILPSLV